MKSTVGAAIVLACLCGPVDGVHAQAPGDGQWEGQLRSDDLPCSPCRVVVIIRDGIGTASGPVELSGFKVSPDGSVAAITRRGGGPGTSSTCRLTGWLKQDQITLSGACGADSELRLTRRGSAPDTAAAPPPPATAQRRNPDVAATPPPGGASPLPAVPVAPSDFGAGTQPVRLAKIEYGMPAGARIGETQIGSWATSCGAREKRQLNHNGRAEVMEMSGFRRDFAAAMRRAGYTNDDLGGNSAYVVIATITDMDLIFCVRDGSNPPQFSGSGRMTITWRVTTPNGTTVLYRTTTAGGKEVPSAARSSDGLGIILSETFATAVQALAADQGFRNAVTRPLPASAQPRLSPNDSISTVRSPRLFQGAITGRMDHVLAATVVILSPGAFGSGFVVDSSGLILTNAHVVRTAQTVDVLFNNGDRQQAVVVRTDRDRDVALLRVGKTGLRALPIRQSKPILTEQVYAIGAPRGLDQTVTRGIVSAMRDLRGMTWIQSDTAISPGSSGGPLVDAAGNVIGISTLGLRDTAGVFLFVPIVDALGRLGVTLAQ